MNQPQLNHSQSNIDSISPPASDVIVRKGDNSFADAYSAFMDNSGTLHTTLDAELRSLITHQPSTYHRLHTNRLPTISCIPPHLTYRPFKHTHSHTHTHTHTTPRTYHPLYMPTSYIQPILNTAPYTSTSCIPPLTYQLRTHPLLHTNLFIHLFSHSKLSHIPANPSYIPSGLQASRNCWSRELRPITACIEAVSTRSTSDTRCFPTAVPLPPSYFPPLHPCVHRSCVDTLNL